MTRRPADSATFKYAGSSFSAANVSHVLVDNDPLRLQNYTDHWLILCIQVSHCDKAYSQVNLLTRLRKESWVICHQRCENWMFFSVNQNVLIICWIHVNVLFVNLLRSLKNMQFKNIILQLFSEEPSCWDDCCRWFNKNKNGGRASVS